jgi:RNA polymerase sigma factor (sigma-70 family)
MKEKTEDMILIQGILDGNPVAQEVIYNSYRKIVKNYILSRFSPYYDIDDDVSEIMIKVFMNLKNYDNEKSQFKSWVINITKNYLIDKWRCKLSPNINSTLDNNSNYFCYANNSFTTSCFENNNAVNYISTQLSPGDYTLLDMKYVQGYNYNEIGQEFQITSSTVSNKINYIKTKLKKNIKEDLYN